MKTKYILPVLSLLILASCGQSSTPAYTPSVAPSLSGNTVSNQDLVTGNPIPESPSPTTSSVSVD